MSHVFNNFANLSAHYKNGVDFGIQHENRAGEMLILAPHGGGIERGTSELAIAIAGNNLSLYLFEGLLPKARQSHRLHITSTRFDEPICCEAINKFSTSMAIHGCNGPNPLIYVGGRDEDLKNRLLETLGERGYSVKIGTGAYAGSSKSNICNRTFAGRGVQLELSNGFRRLLFDSWQTRRGRNLKTALFDRFVKDIRRILEQGNLINIDRSLQERNSLLLSDLGLDKCVQCGKLVMGSEKDGHVKDVHRGIQVEWTRVGK
jgi:phage replication-related protein YjqB (UPF0714/DUF867 family)